MKRDKLNTSLLACFILRKSRSESHKPLNLDKLSCVPFTENASYSASWCKKWCWMLKKIPGKKNRITLEKQGLYGGGICRT